MQGNETSNLSGEHIDNSISDIDWKAKFEALLTERNALILERDVLSNQCHALLSRRDDLERELHEAEAQLERVAAGSAWPISQAWNGIVARFPRALRRQA